MVINMIKCFSFTISLISHSDDLDEDVYEPATNWTWPLASFLKQESVASPAEESFSNV